MIVLHVLRVLVYVFFGFNVQRLESEWKVEPVPIDFVIGQWLQSLVYALFLFIGGVERMVLYHFAHKTYCKVVLERLQRWDTSFLELKVKQKLEDWSQKAPQLLHEEDDPNDLVGSARKRVRSTKQLIFMFLVNPTSKAISIPLYPDLGYELLILDTTMWKFVQAVVFRYQLEHLPYFDKDLTEEGNHDIIQDMFLKGLLEAL